MLASCDSGEGALGSKHGGRLAGAAVEGRSWEAEEPALNPPPEQKCCKESGGREDGDSRVRWWWGSGRQARGRPGGAGDSPRTGLAVGSGPEKAWGRPRGGLTAGPGQRSPFSATLATRGGAFWGWAVVLGGENNRE